MPRLRRRMSSAARRPSSLWVGGMRTSVTTMSGRCAIALRTRSVASAAWPTTSKPASVSNRTSPSRYSSWSSPITTRMGSPPRAPFPGRACCRTRAGPRARRPDRRARAAAAQEPTRRGVDQVGRVPEQPRPQHDHQRRADHPPERFEGLEAPRSAQPRRPIADASDRPDRGERRERHRRRRRRQLREVAARGRPDRRPWRNRVIGDGHQPAKELPVDHLGRPLKQRLQQRPEPLDGRGAEPAGDGIDPGAHDPA